MRIPRANITRFLAACALTACLAACGGGGGGNAVGDGGGIIGTDKQVVARGEVNGFGGTTATGLGSVIVNGTEFSRSNTPGVSPAPIALAFDNISTSRVDALRTGMLVAVSGSYNSVSRKGSYTAIVFPSNCAAHWTTVRSIPLPAVARCWGVQFRAAPRPSLTASAI